jgi:radical SAM protein with 4Fe4S-binding SPASM domain
MAAAVTVVADAAGAVAAINNQKKHFILQWHITEQCNRSCLHCYQEKDPAKDLEFSNLLEIIKQWKELLLKWGGAQGDASALGHINVTGGEPFCRSDFFKLLEIFHENRQFFTYAVLTNGSLITKETAKRLKKLGTEFVQVSMEGDHATHDSIRGRGSFEETVSAIKNLASEKVKTYLSFTAHEGNYISFRHVARLARQYKIKKVWADRFVPFGQGAAMKDRTLDPQKTVDFIRIMDQERRRYILNHFSGTEISMNRSLQFFAPGNKPYRCSAGDTLLTIMHDGMLYPCRRLPVSAGNVMETSLADLYFNSSLLKTLREPVTAIKGCENCSCLPYCRGGSKCIAYAVTGDMFQADPGCPIAAQAMAR